jgi:uncharacterized repeat protein (TIGR03837 family)
MQFSVFCRVVDNHGDAGVCVRLARALVRRGQAVRLFIDDARALAWMGDLDGIQIAAWPQAEDQPILGDVLIEAFGCELPLGVQAAWARSPGKAWINLEYLSAEPYVERSHGLPSPIMSGPARGCIKRFCYPGFTPATGGLLRDADIEAPSPDLGTRAGERTVSLFCYPHAPLMALLDALADAPTHLLVCGGIELPPSPPSVRVSRLPWLSQRDYDSLLRHCDLNLVRGEDSFVRAQWAGKPMLWHIYPQQDGVHADKLDAYLRLRQIDSTAWRVWNGLSSQTLSLDTMWTPPMRAEAQAWREQLHALPDLVDTLMTMAAG